MNFQAFFCPVLCFNAANVRGAAVAFARRQEIVAVIELSAFVSRCRFFAASLGLDHRDTLVDIFRLPF